MREWRYNSTILHFGTRWRWVVTFTPRPLYPRRKNPRYPLDMSLGGPQRRSGRRGEEKKFVFWQESNHGPPDHSPLLLPTGPSRFLEQLKSVGAWAKLLSDGPVFTFYIATLTVAQGAWCRTMVNDELEGMRKEMEGTWFEAWSPLLCGGKQESHEEPRSGEPVSGSRFELVTTWIRSMHVAAYM
jgi:hypothetical protein